jgi:hypothetical protein
LQPKGSFLTITLVDSPVGPYSPAAEIIAWVQECRRMAKLHPDDQGWRFALDSAEYETSLAGVVVQPEAI